VGPFLCMIISNLWWAQTHSGPPPHKVRDRERIELVVCKKPVYWRGGLQEAKNGGSQYYLKRPCHEICRQRGGYMQVQMKLHDLYTVYGTF